MILLTYHARPVTIAVKPDDIAGAFLNCWVSTVDHRVAQEKANELMAENGWTEIQLEEIINVNRSDYGDNDEKLKYFEQALLDNEALVTFTYPLVDKDEE